MSNRSAAKHNPRVLKTGRGHGLGRWRLLFDNPTEVNVQFTFPTFHFF